jgi:hypothetical protein
MVTQSELDELFPADEIEHHIAVFELLLYTAANLERLCDEANVPEGYMVEVKSMVAKMEALGMRMQREFYRKEVRPVLDGRDQIDQQTIETWLYAARNEVLNTNLPPMRNDYGPGGHCAFDA